MTLRDKLKALTEPSREVDVEIAKSFDEVSLYFTASLDAAVELVEREMPGNWDVIRLHPYNTYSGAIQGKHHSEHTLPAVALLLALLDAKGVDT